MNGYGRELKRRRDAAGMTVRALGDLIERSGTFVTNFELGRASNPPEPAMMARLADALDWPVTEQLRAWGYWIEPEPVVQANPFPREDIRFHVVEKMKTADMDGENGTFWTMHYTTELWLYRDMEVYGLSQPQQQVEPAPTPYGGPMAEDQIA